MQVSCPKCRETYEFDASEIPVEGYDAQCTSCSEIFFVQREAQPADDEPSEEVAEEAVKEVVEEAVEEVVEAAVEEAVEVPEEVSVSCPHCRAGYQFAIADIPAEGYDAQCTQCDGVFFVPGRPVPEVSEPGEVKEESPSSPPVDQALEAGDGTEAVESPKDPPDEPAEAASSAEPSEPEASAAPSESEPSADSSEPEPSADSSESAPSADPSGPEPSADPSEPESSADPSESESSADPSESAPSADSSEPEPPAPELVELDDEETTVTEDLSGLSDELMDAGVLVEEELELARQKKRRLLKMGGAVIAALVGLSGALYVGLPQVFDATIGPLIGIKAEINPEAILWVEKAKKSILLDTGEGYEQTLRSLEQALTIDAQYPEAIGLKVLCHVLRGVDQQGLGKEKFDEGMIAQEKLSRLEKSSRRRRSRKNKKVISGLKEQMTRANQESKKHFEAGGEEIKQASVLLTQGLATYPKSPEVALAAGVLASTDPDGRAKAGKLLERSLELQGIKEKGEKVDLSKVSDLWPAFLYGLILSEDPYKFKEAPAAFLRALVLEPGFHRARYQLALSYEKMGELDKALKVIGEVTAVSKEHSRAKALVERLEALKKPVVKERKKGRRRRKR